MNKITLGRLNSAILTSFLGASSLLIPIQASAQADQKMTCDIWAATGALEASQHKLEIIYETPDACSTGNWQTYDVYSEQSVAIRFEVPKEQSKKYQLEKLELWMMNNSVMGNAQVFISIRGHDEAKGIPNDKIIESWILTLSPDNNVPALEEMRSELHPVLKQGKFYWIVAEALTANDVYHVGWNKVAPAFNEPKTTDAEPYLALKTSGNDWQPMFGPETSTVSVSVKGKPVS